MEGTSGCNSFGVDYAVDGQGFRLAEIHRNVFDCQEPAGIMQQDEAFFEALARITALRATEERLEFENSAGETILVYARKLPAVVDPALEDSEWLLTSLGGDSLLAESRITLNLGKEGFGGFAGCNNYGGEYEAADEGILLMPEISSTAMDCHSPEGVMEQEMAYVRALRSSAAYRLTDGRLEIADAGGEPILVFSRKDEFATDPGALLGTAWRLVSIDNESLVDGPAFSLAFYNEHILGGNAGCRDYVATYQTNGDNLNLLFEAMFDRDCRVEDADLEREWQFLGVMAPKADLRLGAGQLAIYGERGGVLVFEALPEEATLDLEGPTWSLLAFVGPNPYVEEPEPWPVPNGLLAGTAVDLTFEAGAARGTAGCNSYGGAVSGAGPSLSFGTITRTEMACLDPAGVMEQEAHYLEILAAITGYHVYGDHLWLETDDGRALLFFTSGP